jgi:hypothetical protein
MNSSKQQKINTLIQNENIKNIQSQITFIINEKNRLIEDKIKLINIINNLQKENINLQENYNNLQKENINLSKLNFSVTNL